MNANLVLLNSNGAHKTFGMPNPVTVLGRRHDCDLRIPLSMVSRRHCQLTRNSDTLKLRDLGSRGGTFVNGAKVDAEKEIPIKPGDYIGIGPLTFVCQIDGQPAKIVPPPKKKSTPQAGKAKAKPQKAARPASKNELAKELDEELGEKLNAELDGDLGSEELDEKLGDELDDLDVSDSFINLDDLDADMEDLKDA